MTTHKLIPYWIRMGETASEEDRWELDNLTPESNGLIHENSVIEMFESFLDEFESEQDEDDDENPNVGKWYDSQKTFSTENTVLSSSERVIEGTIRVGRWGEGADHYNVDDDDRIVDARGPADAVEIPYYFLLHLPERNRTRALFMLHKPGNMGAKGTIEHFLMDDVEGWLPNSCYFSFNPVVTREIYQKIVDADRLRKLKLDKRRVSPSPDDRLADLFDAERSMKETIEFNAHRGEELPVELDGIRDLIEAYRNQNSESEPDDDYSPATIEILGQEFSEAKIQIEKNNSKRTFSLTSGEANMQRIIDEEQDHIDLDSQEHPQPESMSRVAREFANEILEQHAEETIDTTPTL